MSNAKKKVQTETKRGGIFKAPEEKVTKISISLTPDAFEIYREFPAGKRSRIISDLIAYHGSANGY